MQVEVVTFPIDVKITVNNCDELDAVWRFKNQIADREVEELMNEVRDFENSQKSSKQKRWKKKKRKVQDSKDWIHAYESRPVMKAMGEFTKADLCNALNLVRTRRNMLKCNHHVCQAVRDGVVFKTEKQRRAF